MLRVLTDDDIAEVLDIGELLDVVEGGLIAQYQGTIERPQRPHLPLGVGLENDHPLGTGLVMPAYVHGSQYFVTKLVGLFEGNRKRGLPTIQGSILIIDARTGQALGLFDGTRITDARTGCVGGVAARALCDGVVTLGVLGAGQQARWQTRAIAHGCGVDEVRIYSPSMSREVCADDLVDEGIPARAVESPVAAVEGADIVVTATTSNEPVFPRAALEPDVIVIAVGAFTPEMQEIEAAVVEDAIQVFGDVPEEVAHTGDIGLADIDPDKIAPLGGLLTGDIGRTEGGGIVLVESVGSAVFDAVVSEHLFERAQHAELGVTLPFQ